MYPDWNKNINKSAFRDRIVHHAICNIIEPLFERKFIYDSYANRIGKGTKKSGNYFHSIVFQVRKIF